MFLTLDMEKEGVSCRFEFRNKKMGDQFDNLLFQWFEYNRDSLYHPEIRLEWKVIKADKPSIAANELLEDEYVVKDYWCSGDVIKIMKQVDSKYPDEHIEFNLRIVDEPR